MYAEPKQLHLVEYFIHSMIYYQVALQIRSATRPRYVPPTENIQGLPLMSDRHMQVAQVSRNNILMYEASTQTKVPM